MEIIYDEVDDGLSVEDLREKYFNLEFSNFYEHSHSLLNNSNRIENFLWREPLRKMNLDFINRAGILILSAEEDKNVNFSVYRSLLANWLKKSSEVMSTGYEPNQLFAKILNDGLNRYRKFLEIENDQNLKKDITFLESSGSIVRELSNLSNTTGLESIIGDNLEYFACGKNVEDRTAYFNNLGLMADHDLELEILTKIVANLNVDDSIDLSQTFSVEGVSEINHADLNRKQDEIDVPLKICYVLAHAKENNKVEEFIKVFKGYCDRRSSVGYSTSIEDGLVYRLIESNIFSKYSLSENLADWLFKAKVEKVKVDYSENRAFWNEIAGETHLDEVCERMSKMDPERRMDLLKKWLPDEDEFVHKFIAQLMNSGVHSSLDEKKEWSVWIDLLDKNIEVLIQSKKLKEIWESIGASPQTLLYQLGFWLANFPVQSLKNVGTEQLDLIEGVSLGGWRSKLCGNAEIYFIEAFSLNKITSFYDGALLYKGLGEGAAICTRDFVVESDTGRKSIFKRGCYYVPVYGTSTNNWSLARPPGGDELPRTSQDLMRLADRWNENHPEVKQQV